MKNNTSLWAALFLGRRRRSPRRNGFTGERKLRLESLELKTLLAADLTITLDDGNVAVRAGEQINYTVDYANEGDMPATGVVISARLPRHTTFDTENSSAGWNCDEGGSRGSGCTLELADPLDAGAAGTATFVVTVDADLSSRVRRIVNASSIRDDSSGGGRYHFFRRGDFDFETTPVVRLLPDLQINVDDGDAEVSPGETITYSIDYANVGAVDSSGVVITQSLPGHTTFDADSSDADWTCEETDSATVCTLEVGDLSADASGTSTFAVTVDTELPAQVRGTRLISRIADDGDNGGDANRWDNWAHETTPIVQSLPDLVLDLDDGVQEEVNPGEPIVYTMEYSNAGAVDASGVIITQRLSSNVSVDLNDAANAGWAVGDNGNGETVYMFDVGGVAVGEHGTTTLTVTVADPLPEDGSRYISSDARIADDGSNGSDPTPRNNADSTRTEIAREDRGDRFGHHFGHWRQSFAWTHSRNRSFRGRF